MRTRSLLIGALTISLLSTGPAAAQQLLPTPDEQMVAEMAAFARTNITKARISDGSFVPPETPEELARPIIPDVLVRQTVARGFLTGEMEACGMDWENESFLPYMAAIRASKLYSDKQLAYIGLLHGLGQGTGAGAVTKLVSNCPAAHIKRLEKVVQETPILTP
jgi:hypothetical protein